MNSSANYTLENPIEFFLLNFKDYFPYTFLACFATLAGMIGIFFLTSFIIIIFLH
jgi:hypothetical protein